MKKEKRKKEKGNTTGNRRQGRKERKVKETKQKKMGNVKEKNKERKKTVTKCSYIDTLEFYR